MSFNWFNRQYSQPEPSEPEPGKPESSSQPSATATTESNPSVAISPEEQLKWAKLALENIKKRQQAAVSSTSPAVDSENSSGVVERAELAAVQVGVEETAVSATPTVAAVPEMGEVAAENQDAAVVPLAELGAAIVPDLPTPTESASAVPTPELPLWMQATEEREAKLERLRAAAIDLEDTSPPKASANIPAVAPSTPEADPEPDIVPELALDEGFLWSAEVLAAQGRRAEDVSIEEITWLKRLRQGLDRTRRSLINQLKAIVGQGPLNQDAVESIEELLLQADVGVEATDRIIQSLQQKLREDVLPPEQAISYLKQLLRDMLDDPLKTGNVQRLAPEKDVLNIWLITGVNGAGKTTTIGKLAHIATKSGYRCLIAAADTFRAAAVEQVKVWGQRSQVEVIANPGQNTDPAAVVYDAIAAAQARGTELLLVDTAGRLQNKKNLMDELSKIRRIIDKRAENAQIQAFLVLDASLGQNGVRQAEVFLEAAHLNGVILTKLDGTAKGGVALAVVQQLGLPIRFIGAGEGIEDLRPFSSYEFVEALLSG